MAFQDYADCFSYVERIVLDRAKQLMTDISSKVIEILISMDKGLQSGDDSELTNLWEEICVQLQTDYAATWELYDELVFDLILRELSSLPSSDLAALQYSIDFTECETEYIFDLNDIVREMKSEYVYSEAMNYRNDHITAFLENE